MGKLIAIGELLIDFMGDGKAFLPCVGGAPANVCACVQRLGINAIMISRVGDDNFGDYLISELADAGIDTQYIIQDKIHNTSLAFVQNDVHGERTFTFIRKQAADLFFEKKEMPNILGKGDCLHFGSVDLCTKTNRQAHMSLIGQAIEKHALISFDPNLRFNLWECMDELKHVVNEFIAYANIVKMSKEEMSFIVDTDVNELFRGNVQIVIITDGDKGATLYTRDYQVFVPAVSGIVLDTTGAGDAFMGAFLYQLLKLEKDIADLKKETYFDILRFCAKAASIVVGRRGAFSSMPYRAEII